MKKLSGFVSDKELDVWPEYLRDDGLYWAVKNQVAAQNHLCDMNKVKAHYDPDRRGVVWELEVRT